jgi:hypothetical protein
MSVGSVGKKYVVPVELNPGSIFAAKYLFIIVGG